MRKIEYVCKFCGDMFVAYRSDKRAFCSRTCYHKHLSEKMTGKPNPYFKKGSTRVFSESHRRNLSKALMKRWARGERVGGFRSGKEHWFWKGGITTENYRQRRGTEMKKWRRAVFERDDYTCLLCKKKGGVLNADHIKPFALFPELRFSIDNGRTLCRECHLQTSTWGLRGIRNYKSALKELNGV